MLPPDVRQIVKEKMFLHQKKKKFTFLKFKNDFFNRKNRFNRIQIDNTMIVFFRSLVNYKFRFINLIDFFKKFIFTNQSTDCAKSIFNFSKDMTSEDKCKKLREEYTRWNRQTNNSNEKIRNQARKMVELTASLRKKYNC